MAWSSAGSPTVFFVCDLRAGDALDRRSDLGAGPADVFYHAYGDGCPDHSR